MPSKNPENLVRIDLPIGGEGCGDIRLICDGVEVTLEYEFRSNGKDLIGGIRFVGSVAHRFRDEMRSQGFAPSSYDTVIELLRSEWKRTILRDEPKDLLFSAKNTHHFAVFLSSNGYLEVLAESCEKIGNRQGTLMPTE